MPLHITAIVDGTAYEQKIASRRVQIDGEILIVGSGESVSDTLARVFSAIAEMRKDIDDTE